jgi:hypothetical protein
MKVDLFLTGLATIQRLNELAQIVDAAKVELDIAAEKLALAETDYVLAVHEFCQSSPEAAEFMENMYPEDIWANLQERIRELNDDENG